MKFQIIHNIKNQVKLKITVPSQRIKKYFEQVFIRFASTVEIAGFRPGKAPPRMIIEKIGTARLNREVMDMAIRQNLGKAISLHKLSPVTSPKVNLVKWTFNPLQPSEDDILEYEAEFGLLPPVKLGDYQKIRIKRPAKKPDLKATDQEVEMVLRRLQSQKAKLEEVDRPAQKGDWLEIGLTAKYRGVVQEKLTSQRHPLILGSGSLIPGLEDQLVGLKKDSRKQFQLKMPANFRDQNLAGKKIDFEVIVNQLKKVDLPPLDANFAAKFGHNNMTDLKSAIKKSVAQEKAQKARKDLERQALDSALKLAKIDVPESLIDQEVQRQIELMKQNIARQGMDFEKYLQIIKKTAEDLRKELKLPAQKNIEMGLMLGEVAKREGWDPRDKETAQKAVKKLVEIATS